MLPTMYASFICSSSLSLRGGGGEEPDGGPAQPMVLGQQGCSWWPLLTSAFWASEARPQALGSAMA